MEVDQLYGASIIPEVIQYLFDIWIQELGCLVQLQHKPLRQPAPATAAAPAPPPDITLVEAVPGGPSPRPRVHDQDGGPPLPDIVLIGTPNGAGGRTEALPGLGDDPEPSGTPSLDELPDITLVEPPPPAAAPPPATPEPRTRRDPGSDALAARIRPDEARLDAAARALRSRVPPREESERPEEFWLGARARSDRAPGRGRRGRRGLTAPGDRGDSAAASEPAPSLPAAVREIATPRHPPAAAAVPVAVIHGFRSALRALREAPGGGAGPGRIVWAALTRAPARSG